MKRENYSLKGLLFLSLGILNQNAYSQDDSGNQCHDPYTITDEVIGQFGGVSEDAPEGYTGEFELFINNLYWPLVEIDEYEAFYYTWSPSEIAGKLEVTTELVSFPFTPNCIIGDCGNPDSNTKLFTNYDLSYYQNDIFDYRYSETINGVDYNYSPIKRIQTESISSDSYNDNYHGLTSYYNHFEELEYTPTSTRTVYPHSVLKYTFRLFQDTQHTELIDEREYVIDLTKGAMRMYPFKDYNSNTSESQHDVVLMPVFINGEFVIQMRNYEGDHYAGYTNSGELYDYSQFNEYNTHTYEVNKPFDLSILNPEQKIIYNPSEMNINIGDIHNPLIFPEGYTFKTVQSGCSATDEGPTVSTMPEQIYNSTYYVKSGSKLVIGPCVTLDHLNILVEEGGIVEWSPESTTMIQSSIESIGGQIIEIVDYNCFATTCQDYFDFNNDMVVNSSQNWSENELPGDVGSKIKFGSNLIITNGATLTINPGVELEFSATSKIIVENGAKLIADGVRFYTACDNKWEGIEVYDDNTGFNSSKLILTSCDIENSKKGIVLGREESGTTKGGIALINDCTFTNNGRILKVLNKSNFGSFALDGIDEPTELIGCTIINNSSEWQELDKLVHIKKASGIEIQGCNFDNQTNQTGVYAIKVENAGVRVVENDLKNYEYGVHVRNIAKPVKIMSNTIDAYRSIYLDGSNNAKLTNNTITTHDIHDSYGIYLDQCTAYTVENNTIQSGAIGETQDAGIIVNNSGPYSNTIYRNNITGAYVATLAQGVNKQGLNGLQYQCNNFSENGFDIAVTAENNLEMEIELEPSNFIGISPNQGNGFLPAGNRFSHNTLYDYSDFRNDYEHIVYYHSNAPYEEPLSTIGVTKEPLNDVYNPCTPSPDYEEPVLINLLADVKGELITKKTDLFNLLDGGDTESLNDEVIYSDFSEAVALTYNLLNKSPYLSKKVLISAIEKEFDLPNSLMTLILQANPHSVKKGSLKTKIEAKMVPLSDYQKYLINQGLDVVSEKEIMEAEIASFHSLEAKYNQALFDIYAEQQNTQALEELVAGSSDFSMNINHVMYYLAKGDLTEATAKWELISGSFDLDGYQEAEYYRLSELFDSFDLTGLNSELASNEIIALPANIDRFDLSASYSRTLLDVAGHLSYEEAILYPSETEMRVASELAESDFERIAFNIYPNPTKDYVFVTTEDLFFMKNAHIEITDVSGRVLYQKPLALGNNQKMIDIKEYPSGAYFLLVIADQGLKHSEIISIQK